MSCECLRENGEMKQKVNFCEALIFTGFKSTECFFYRLNMQKWSMKSSDASVFTCSPCKCSCCLNVPDRAGKENHDVTTAGSVEDAFIERLQPTFQASHYGSNMNFSPHVQMNI